MGPGADASYVYENPPIFSGVNGVAELFCAIEQRGHDRKENPGWTQASDNCSKWKRKDI